MLFRIEFAICCLVAGMGIAVTLGESRTPVGAGAGIWMAAFAVCCALAGGLLAEQFRKARAPLGQFGVMVTGAFAGGLGSAHLGLGAFGLLLAVTAAAMGSVALSRSTPASGSGTRIVEAGLAIVTSAVTGMGAGYLEAGLASGSLAKGLQGAGGAGAAIAFPLIAVIGVAIYYGLAHEDEDARFRGMVDIGSRSFVAGCLITAMFGPILGLFASAGALIASYCIQIYLYSAASTAGAATGISQ